MFWRKNNLGGRKAKRPPSSQRHRPLPRPAGRTSPIRRRRAGGPAGAPAHHRRRKNPLSESTVSTRARFLTAARFQSFPQPACSPPAAAGRLRSAAARAQRRTRRGGGAVARSAATCRASASSSPRAGEARPSRPCSAIAKARARAGSGGLPGGVSGSGCQRYPWSTRAMQYVYTEAESSRPYRRKG